MTRVCAYSKCDVEFEPTRPHHRFCQESCRYADWEERQAICADNALASVSEHPLAEARADQEASKLKSDLSALIYQGIIERLTVAPIHADELEPLYPIEHRALCRKLAPAQFGSLASRRYIRKIGERKSKFRSRNAAKSGIYELTQLGREKLVGHRVAGAPRGGTDASTRAGVDGACNPVSGEQPAQSTTDASSSQDRASGRPARQCVGVREGGAGSSAVHTSLPAAGEPRPTLFELPVEGPGHDRIREAA